jgi:nucleotide-binding universal stress UspA family protein
MGEPNQMDHAPHYREQLAANCDRPSATVIVVGIDGSETSWDAFWWATGQARRLGSSRIVATFVSPTVDINLVVASAAFAAAPCDYAGAAQIATDRAEGLRRQLEGYAAEHDIQVSFIHAHGDPTAELSRIAEECQADIIVVGKSTKALHHVAGSLGRRLIGRRKAPVVAVVP